MMTSAAIVFSLYAFVPKVLQENIPYSLRISFLCLYTLIILVKYFYAVLNNGDRFQGPVDGTFFGDLQQSFPLFIRHFSPDDDVPRDGFNSPLLFGAIDAIVAVRALMVEFDADCFDGDFLSLGVQKERHCGACAERTEEQIVRVGPESVAVFQWFIDNERMRICNDLVLKIFEVTYCYFIPHL
jgi:hypothetical protein